MGELLYLYLEENNLLDDLASSLVVERNVELLSKLKSDEKAYFEGSRYIDNKDFREYLDCYQYTYAVNTRFILNDEVVFSYLTNNSGISVEDEKPFGVFGNENTTTDYFDASGKEVVEYQKVLTEDNTEDYRLKHICYNGELRNKGLRLPMTLRSLLTTEDNFATVICNMYNIDLSSYHSDKLRREHVLRKIEIIDAEIARLEKLKKELMSEVSLGEGSTRKVRI